MRIDDDSQLPLTALKGALLTNEHGAEYRIHGLLVDFGQGPEVFVSLKGHDEEGGTGGSVIKSWKIQLQGGME